MKKFSIVFTAALCLLGCGKQQQVVPMYGSHFLQDNWMPAQGIAERGAVKRTRASGGGTRGSVRSQTIFDQPYDYSGYNDGASCHVGFSGSGVQNILRVGESVLLALTFTTPDTYLAQFASTNNSFQMTGIRATTNGSYAITGYFNQAGSITVSIAASNTPYTSTTTCSTVATVQGGWSPNNNNFWSWWYAPPYQWYDRYPNPYYYGGYTNSYGTQVTYYTYNTNVLGNNTTNSNNTTNNIVYNTPAPTPAPTAAPTPPPPQPVPLYRSRIARQLSGSSIYEDFLYSTNQAEGAGAYTLEGVAFYVMPTSYGNFTLPLMRCLVNGATSLPYHFLSIDAGCEGQRVEGALGYVSPGYVSGTTQIFRLYKGTTGAHLTTKSQTEINSAVGLGYQLEGTQGWAY